MRWISSLRRFAVSSYNETFPNVLSNRFSDFLFVFKVHI